MIALDELKKLPIEEREQIIEELEKSIEEERSGYEEPPGLPAELERRMAEHHADPSLAVSLEVFKAKLLARGA